MEATEPSTPAEPPESSTPSAESSAATEVEEGGGILGRTVGAILGVGPGREAPEAEAEAPADRINLNTASFEELRDLGFSVTQATRVITYREREKGFKSVDDLADVPGMPPDLLGEVKDKLTL
jgi:competence ComEA-like helix-hairpin-helix protein